MGLKRVYLYQTMKSEHLISGDYIELSKLNYEEITPIRDGSGEFIIGKVISKQMKFPVQKYVFSNKHWKTGEVVENIVYAAFDDELLKLIQCERSKFQNMQIDLQSKTNKISMLSKEIDNLKYLHLKDKVKLANIQQMNFLKRLKFIFSKGGLNDLVQ